MKVLLWIFLLCVASFGIDAPVSLGTSPAARLNVLGPAGFASSPSRIGEPAVYITLWKSTEVQEYAWSAGGEWTWGSIRSAFFSEIHQLDSLYNQLYSEVDVSYRRNNLVAGLGYGFSMEWVPETAQWSRNRVKIGTAYFQNGWYISSLMDFWYTSFERQVEFIVGGGVELKKWGTFFIEWDGKSVAMGNSVKWKFLELKSAYSFPEFGVALAANFSLDLFSAESAYTFSSEKIGWFGIGVQKRIAKKTIL